MKILERRLCRLGKGRGFYIPEKYMTDEQIGEDFDLIVTPHKNKESIRSKVLHLLSDGNSWTIPDLAAQSCQHVNQPAHVIYEFIESILDTVPEIIKAGNARYRLSEH